MKTKPLCTLCTTRAPPSWIRRFTIFTDLVQREGYGGVKLQYRKLKLKEGPSLNLHLTSTWRFSAPCFPSSHMKKSQAHACNCWRVRGQTRPGTILVAIESSCNLEYRPRSAGCGLIRKYEADCLGTFCKTKIATFVKARGRGAKKMAHVRECPHESSCRQPSLWTKFSFRDRTFVRRIEWFSWFRAVVRLVLSIQLDLPAFFCIEIWTSVMFSWSTFKLWWVACMCAEWLFEPVAAVDGNRFSSNLQWTWFCVCGLEDQRTNSSSSMSPSSWESSRRREKCENPPSQPNKLPNSNRLVRTSHTIFRQGQWHDQQSDRTETAIFCLQNDAMVRRTVTTFVWPQTQFHENLHIRISFCKTSLLLLWLLL